MGAAYAGSGAAQYSSPLAVVWVHTRAAAAGWQWHVRPVRMGRWRSTRAQPHRLQIATLAQPTPLCSTDFAPPRPAPPCSTLLSPPSRKALGTL